MKYCTLITHALFYFSFAYGLEEKYLTFPDGFLIGSATSSYQIEGGWNSSDKGENAWDRFTHARPDLITDGSNGDIACDSYHKYKEDVQLLKQMGMNVYRFSISWSRILPSGHANFISKDGVKYYHKLLDELEKHNIKPFVTLYHWDHPQVFQDIGGWTNEAMVELFADYARVIFREFGTRVKFFATINEPHSVCTSKLMPNETSTTNFARYLCNFNILKAHARAYHIYDDEFRASQNGKVGIVINSRHYFSKHKDDDKSGDIAFQFNYGMYAHPIFSKEGDWPAVVKQRIAENSKYEGLLRSRLPSFSKQWVDYIRGTADYLGFNHYTSNYVEPAPKSNRTVYENDDGLMYSYDEKWPISVTGWLRIVPEGFLAHLLKVKEEYNNPLVYVTENGIPDAGTLEDNERLVYLHSYMKSMLTAVHEHGCNIRGYMVWSLLDNFEWASGYTEKFGLVHVDFTSPNRTRTPKKSTSWLGNVIRTRKLLPIPK